MNEKYTSDNINDGDSNMNNDDFDYKKLINRLEEISATIFLLEKKYQDKF